MPKTQTRYLQESPANAVQQTKPAVQEPLTIIVEEERREERRNEFLVELKKLLQRCAHQTTIEGIRNVMSSPNRLLKIAWLVFMVVSSCACFYMVVRLILIYLEFNQLSSIRQVSHKELRFPNISICNPNFMITPEATRFLREFYLNNYNHTFTNFDDLFDSRLESEYLPNFQLFIETFKKDFNQTVKKSFSYSLEDMLIKCEFNSKPCNLSWFEWYSHAFFGNCYKFNTGSLNGGFYFFQYSFLV